MSPKVAHFYMINCGAPSKTRMGGGGCPKNPKGHRFRGVSKCYGCSHASVKGRPYGPRRMQPRRQSP